MEFRKPRKKSRKRLVIIIILLCLVFLLFSLSVTYTVDEMTYPESAGYETGNVHTNSSYEYCTNENYTYGYQWVELAVDNQFGKLIPKMEITNLMDRTGMFRVQFAFVDEERYPFAAYENRIGEVVPAMVGKEQWVTLYPNKLLLVLDYVDVPGGQGTYWSFADITPPTLRFCEIVQMELEEETYQNSTINVLKQVRKKKTASLGTYLWYLIVNLQN
ncbi:MAG: hypothetical protein ABIJ21_08130 [Nanoarchaeota archaeon]